MGAILSGIVLHGPTRAYGGTFLQFSDYMRGAVRLAAVMGAPAIYVWTHDSIGLGEDGPTHQPIEHLAALRAIPGWRSSGPADGNETAYAWRRPWTSSRCSRPGRSGWRLTRQNVPTLEGTSAEGVARGAYILAEADGDLQVILFGSGSEVQTGGQGQGSCCRPRASAPGWCPCRAWTGSRRRTPRTSNRCCRPRSPPGCRSRPGSRSRGGGGSAPPAGRCRSSTTAPRRTPPPCSANSVSPPSTSWPTPRNPWPRPASRRQASAPHRTPTCSHHVGADTGTAHEAGTAND